MSTKEDKKLLNVNKSELEEKPGDAGGIVGMETNVPCITDSDQVIILKHSLIEFSPLAKDSGKPPSIDTAIRNITDSTIATVLLEATFYDEEGNILDKVEHIEVELKPGVSRGVVIRASNASLHDMVKSYAIKVLRVITADIERVQFRRNFTKTNEFGEEEVTGSVKNISDIKTDTAIVATFYDYRKEIIGTNVALIEGIDPQSIRTYQFKFKPHHDDKVASCSVVIGGVVEC